MRIRQAGVRLLLLFAVDDDGSQSKLQKLPRNCSQAEQNRHWRLEILTAPTWPHNQAQQRRDRHLAFDGEITD